MRSMVCGLGGSAERVGEKLVQGFQWRKFRYRVKPWAALFSGWNWVAKILSLAKALVKRCP
jgi:hypothetical protein